MIENTSDSEIPAMTACLAIFEAEPSPFDDYDYEDWMEDVD